MSQLISLRSKKFIVLVVIAVLCVPLFVSNNVVAKEKDKFQFKLGALLPLSGPLADFGEAHLAAITLAVADVKDLLVQAGAMDASDELLIVRDTAGNTENALTELRYLHEVEGIQLVIGPMTSEEVIGITEYADENKIVVVSQSSSLPGAAVADDFIFRFYPHDYVEARVITQLLTSNFIDNVVAVYDEWVWNSGLLDVYETTYEDVTGDTFTSKIPITDADVTAAAINAAVEGGGNGVLFLGWGDQTANVMTEAREYEALWSVRWFGISMNVLADQIISSLEAAEFSVATGFTAPEFAPMKSFKHDRIHDALEAQLGREADIYAYIAYDIVWALMYAYSLIAEAKEPDSGMIKDVLPTVTESLFGASGWIQLNDAGDRAFANYDFYSVEQVSFEVFEWTQVGRYCAYSDSLRWFLTS
jgi:branched-chain amino acid transport system substrate-binding protein